MGWFKNQKARSQDKGGSMARRISGDGTKRAVTTQVTVKRSGDMIAAMADMGYELKQQSQGAVGNMVVLSFTK